MMYWKNILSAFVAFVALSACSGGLSRDPQAIAVASCLEDGIATRSPYTGTVPSSDNPLSADVWVSTTSHTYPGAQVGADNDNVSVIDYHNSATFTSDSKQLLSTQLYYPSNNAFVYLSGFYPSGAWAANSGGTAVSASFDGSKDMMFAPEVSNRLESSATYPILHFAHLLTWIRFNIFAENQETADVWGKLNSIVIRSKDQVSVDLATDAVTFTESSAGLQMPLRLVSDDSQLESKDIALPIQSSYMAYILCSPVSAVDNDSEYTITINTTKRHNIQVPINLKASDGSADFTGNTAGCQFTVNLKFVQGDNILTSAVVSEWQNGGSTFVPVDE